MADVKWTNEQENAISKRDSNILVAAAAGSGKTAVLVERIIRKIVDDNVDIDKILVVTFTSAAASEMRERILEAIYKKIEKNPENTNMHRQINLLNKASICTIDSFCLDVIKNNFFELDISANARVADSAEITILKQETLDEIFEEKYIANDESFLKVIDTYTKYNKDEDLQNLILKIYNYIQTDPFPEEWLEDKVDMFKDVAKSTNFSNTKWGQIIVKYVEDVLNNCILNLENLLEKMNRFPELEKSRGIIRDDIENYMKLKNILRNWDEAADFIQKFKNKTWTSEKKLEENLLQFSKDAKVVRDKAKDEYEKIKDLIPYNTKEASEDILFMYGILEKLKAIILEFSERFYKKKREKNIIDFNDMEHLALKILVKKDDDGNIQISDVAKRYQEKFEEIAIDEYQDSNLVQELILTSVSKNNNIFMVGDVKQSIYKFRQARPELFLQKYDTYKIEPDKGENRKIQLFKNFRSRQNVLDITNIIFKNIMSKKLGNIEYNETEYLNLGANYEDIENQNYIPELNIIDLKDNNDDIWKDSKEEETDQVERVENVVLEARFVAKKIRKLIDERYQVIDKKVGKRDIEFKDIAVLLRSANTMAPIYEKEIASLGISVYCDSSESYFQSTEIETIMSLLKIIDNPMQDIPLVTAMRSTIGGFTDNELIEISLYGNKESFYEKMNKTKDLSENNIIKEKIHQFLEKIDKWRGCEKYKPLDELIWQIYSETGYMNYVQLLPNGKLRVANLKLLFEKAKQYEAASFKGLYNFISFIDKIKMSNGDIGAAKIIGENENVVRIMSIHKSKGLEFPVTILAGTGKSFNFQDLNDKLLLHQDLGLGMQYIDSTRHIEFKTLPKKAIAIMAKNEIISEEMRVLYVALTRAKEKLIITGVQKDVNKILEEKTKAIEVYDKSEKNINSFLVQKYKTYLDWLELVYLKEDMKNILDVNIINKAEIMNEKKEKNEEEALSVVEKIQKEVEKNSNEKQEAEIKKKMNWEYKYSIMNNIPTKTSVTKIKELASKEKIVINNQEIGNIYSSKIAEERHSAEIKPKFLNNDKSVKLSGAEKGTLMHLCIQKMDEKIDYNYETIEKMISDLVKKELITENQSENIDRETLLKYTYSNLWKELKKAKQIYKEQPFYINIPVDEVYKEESTKGANILVQGIIDLYFINNENELVLVDYKTDFVKSGQENILIEKYKKQLELYKQALEQALNRRVDKMGIYSLYLNKFIEL